jgi:flagellar motor protein MotB
MFSRIVMKRGAKDEAEKPFWISYADFMTALMVLFLVVMSVALLMVTKTVTEQERQKARMEKAIADCMGEVNQLAKGFSGVRVDTANRKIDFGDRARFDTNSSQLTLQQAQLLRGFIPGVLDLATHTSCNGWLKEIVVDGFADQRGSYLLNLNLSLQRAQRVLCVLFDKPAPSETALSDTQRDKIRELFRVGGYSFNSSKSTLEESRRIELRLEFHALPEDSKRPPNKIVGDIGSCSI